MITIKERQFYRRGLVAQLGQSNRLLTDGSRDRSPPSPPNVIQMISVDQHLLQEIFHDLQERGYSIHKINNEIGHRFDNPLYYGYSIPEQAFKKLENLVGKKIPINKTKSISERENVVLDENEETAELIGTILGDGHVGIHKYVRRTIYDVSISFNITELKIIDNAFDLLALRTRGYPSGKELA